MRPITGNNLPHNCPGVRQLVPFYMVTNGEYMVYVCTGLLVLAVGGSSLPFPTLLCETNNCSPK